MPEKAAPPSVQSPIPAIAAVLLAAAWPAQAAAGGPDGLPMPALHVPEEAMPAGSDLRTTVQTLRVSSPNVPAHHLSAEQRQQLRDQLRQAAQPPAKGSATAAPPAQSRLPAPPEGR